jgi:hypothetical protein
MGVPRWWTNWSDLIRKLLSYLGSVASLLALLIYFAPSPKSIPWWGMTLLVIAALSCVCFLYLEITSSIGRRVFRTSDKEAIKDYMHNWIRHGGRVAIWTRDMSWAEGPDTLALLRQKAKANELILCLPEENKLSKDLSLAGAEICAYGKTTLELPASRFTINGFGREGARVAVGRGEGNNHVIDEFNSRTSPAFFLAEDLVKIVRAKRGQGPG